MIRGCKQLQTRFFGASDIERPAGVPRRAQLELWGGREGGREGPTVSREIIAPESQLRRSRRVNSRPRRPRAAKPSSQAHCRGATRPRTPASVHNVYRSSFVFRFRRSCVSNSSTGSRNSPHTHPARFRKFSCDSNALGARQRAREGVSSHSFRRLCHRCFSVTQW